LLEEEHLKVIDQGVADISRPTVLKHILPESEIGQEGHKMALEVVGE
jgi:hypothetical protein